MAFNTMVPNELAQLCLVACDMSYKGTSAEPGEVLAPYFDPNPIGPEYEIHQSGFRVLQSFPDQGATGLKAIALRNEQTKDLVLAFGGSDGASPKDWWSNVNHLGWNQWRENRIQIIGAIRPQLNDGYRIHFTGQSLGGALAQFSAYEFLKSTADADRSRVTLTTFNALGGLEGLKSESQDLDLTVFAGIGQARHYVVFNDLVHRLGGGLVGGRPYLLDFRDPNHLRPNGTPYALGIIDSHRIETGFYPHLNDGHDYFSVGSATTVSPLYLPDLQRLAANFGNILGRQGTNSVAATIDIIAGSLFAAVAAPNDQVRQLTNAVVDHANRAGDIGDFNARILKAIPWGAAMKLLAGAAAVANPLIFINTFAGSTFLRLVASGLGTTTSEAQQEIRREFGSASPSSVTAVAVVDAASPLEAAAQFKVLEARIDPENASKVHRVSVEGLAEALTTTGADWQSETLEYVQGTPGLTVGERIALDANFGAVMYDAILETPEVSESYIAEFYSELSEHYVAAGEAIARSNPDFIGDQDGVPSDLFGEVNDVASYRALRDALVAAAESPDNVRIKGALLREIEVVEAAGQAVDLEAHAGISGNPFDIPGFDPHSPDVASSQVLDHGPQAFKLFLPYEAQAARQRIRIDLSGANADRFSITSEGEAIASGSSEFYLTVKEGRRSVSFVLSPEGDFESTGSLSLDATLVDATNAETHQTHREATVSTVDLLDAPFAEVFNAQEGTLELTGTVDPEDFAPNTPQTIHTQLVGTTHGDMIFGDHASEEIWAGAGNDYIFERQNSNGFFRNADDIRAGDGNDWVFGALGSAGALIDVGDGDNVVKASAGPQFMVRLVIADGHPTIPGGVYTGGPLLGHFYSDFAAALDAKDATELPTVDSQGALQFALNYGFDESGGGGTSRILHFAPLPGDTEAIFPETRIDPTVVGGSSYSLSPVGNTAAILTYSGGATPATFRVDVAQDNQAPQTFGALTIRAGSGRDRLFGAGDEDFIQSGGGDDRIAGYGGRDTLLAGAGDDLVIAGAGDDFVDAGSGNNQVWGEAGRDAIFGGSGVDVFVGDSDSTPLASQGDDYLDGGGGDDVLAGNGGQDELLGGDGNDQLRGGVGHDLLDGEAGDDVMAGDAGNDRLYGGGGADQLGAGDGDDSLHGESGTDTLVAGVGFDRLFGGDDADFLSGEGGADLLDGGAGNDVILGGDDADTLIGGSGNDTLTGGGGDDTYAFTAGSGSDTIHDAAGSNVITLDDSFEIRAAQAGAGDLRISHGAGDAVIVQGGLVTSNFSFSVRGQTMSARDLLDRFGDASIRLDGDAILAAYGGTTPDAVVLSGGAQGDMLIAGGLHAITLDGGTGDDVLVGGAGADLLDGGVGADTLTGAGGDDVLVGGEGNDSYAIGPGGGSDTISDASGRNTVAFQHPIFSSEVTAEIGSDPEGGAWLHVRYGVQDNLRIVQFGTNLADYQFTFADGVKWSTQDLLAARATAPVDITGPDAASALFGTGFADVLVGGWEQDVLDGGGGNDFLSGGDGGDHYRFEAGDGIDVIHDFSGFSTIDFAAGVAFTDVDARFIAEPEGQVYLEVQYTPTDMVRIARHGLNLADYSFTFADGTEWSTVNLMEAVLPESVHIAGDDIEAAFFGSRFDDVFSSGSGNELFLGGAGDDTYRFGLGGGVDRIRDTSGVNTLVFGAGITPDMLTLAPGSLIINVGSAGDAVHLETFDPANPLAGSDVDDFRFADGTIYDLEELLATGFSFIGTEFSDRLRGTDIVDIVRGEGSDDMLIGAGGRDHLHGGDGDDVLIGGESAFNLFGQERMGVLWDAGNAYAGGAGSDELWATAGTDVFRFEQGDGVDVVTDVQHDLTWFEYGGRVGDANTLFAQVGNPDHDPSAVDPVHQAQLVSSQDTLRFGEGIEAAQVQVIRETAPLQWRTSDDLVFRVSEGNEVRFRNWFSAEVNQLNRVEFANGRVWNLATINARLNGVPESNSSPPALSAPISDQAASEDAEFVFSIPAETFSDPDGDDLSYEISQADGSALPGWLSFDAQALQLEGTPANLEVGTVVLRVTATDPSGFSASDQFALKIANVNDAPTASAPLGARSVEAGTQFVFGIPAQTFADEDTGDSLSLSAQLRSGEALPSWLAFDPVTGTFTGNPQTTDIGLSIVEVTATDGAGETATADLALVVRVPSGATGVGGAGDDVIHGGDGDETLIARGGDDYVFGGEGSDTLRGGNGNDVLQGGAGDDTLRGGSGQNVLDGGEGADLIYGGQGSAFISGGAGNDILRVGQGNDVVAFNRGDGIDTLYGGRDGGNTLSLGGGIGYHDLSLSKAGRDLVLNVGPVDRLVLKNWYNGNTSVLNLQVIAEAMAEFDATSTDPLYNKRVQTFDFMGLVSAFDAARAENPGVSSWALTNALLQWHLDHSDDAALGGDLAYAYGKNGSLSGISVDAAQQVIGTPGFGSDAQTLRPFSGLQEGFAKLS